MFEQLVNDTASRLDLPVAGVSGLVRGLLSLITSDRTGGPEGFVDRFRQAGLGDVITSWFGGRDGTAITPPEVESALGAGTLDTLASSSGLPRAATASALTLLLPKVIGRLTPGGTFLPTSEILSQVSGFMRRPTAPAVERAASVPDIEIERTEQRRPSLRWLPWAVAALLVLGGFLWLRGRSAGTADPQLTLSNQNGKVIYSGVVHDDGERTTIVKVLRTTIGDGNVEGNLRVDPNVRRAAWLPRVGALSAAMRTPGAECSLSGDAISTGGWLSDADRQAFNDKVHAIFGAQAPIGSLGDASAEATRAANDKAISALGAIGTSGASPDAVVQAMNLSVINFPSGSADVPADSMEVIRKSAEAIKQAPAGSTIEIDGHTDNSGDASRNLALSQARAEKVKAALVAAGAPASMLTTKGYGDTRPKASNDTEYGRFQNRRIEYIVVH